MGKKMFEVGKLKELMGFDFLFSIFYWWSRFAGLFKERHLYKFSRRDAETQRKAKTHHEGKKSTKKRKGAKLIFFL